MRLTYKSGVFVAEASYEERHICKAAGLWWNNPISKKWSTRDPEKAAKLIQYADETAKPHLEDAARKREKALEESRALDADINVPAPEGEDYLPFQRGGISFLKNHVNSLVGDEMGLGKTIQALGLINMNRSIQTVLVVCPASLKMNWAREARKWLVRPANIFIINSDKKKWREDRYRDDNPEVMVQIINYDILKKYEAHIKSFVWDLLIVDECHYLKNSKAQRTRHVFGYKGKKYAQQGPIKAVRKVFMTGTPIVNRPIELWNIARNLAPDTFRSWKYYTQRYCDAHHDGWGWNVKGASNLEELHEKLRSTIMIRRLKKEVLTELPPKFRQIIEVPPNGFQRVIDREQKFFAEHRARLEELEYKVELAKTSDNPDDYKEAVAALSDGYRVAFNEMSTVRRETAESKVPAVIDHVTDALEANEKIVLFAHHHSVIDAIADHFGDIAVKFTGKTPFEERDEAVKAFQESPDIKLFIGSITAAGVGITLTAASLVIFAELDWVPGNVTQAEDRLHRIGQTDNVLVQHLVLDGSIDSEIAKRLVEKQKVIDRALDLSPEEASQFDAEALKTAEFAASQELKESESKKKSRKGLETIAESLSESQIKAIHIGLKRLATVCDGAMALDGHGFNKFDARIGRDLASNLFLSPKQAALGKLVITKYRGQLGEDLMRMINGE